MSPQEFVNQLNEAEMPKLGYVKHNGMWLWPVQHSRDGVALTVYEYPDGRRYVGPRPIEHNRSRYP